MVVTVCRVALAHLRDRSGPEHLADHRRIRQQRLRLWLQRVQPGGDQRLHRLRERHLRTLSQLPARAHPLKQIPVLEQADELLRVQRVATGAVEDRLLQLHRDHRRLEQGRDETGGLLRRRAAPG